jgi:hypothetical protein
MKKILMSLIATSILAIGINAREVSIATQVAGLYAGYFNRAPDQQGLDYWIGRATEAQQQGISADTVLKDLSRGFAAHPTFTATYGEMDNMSFVEEIYRNALGRDGDRPGIEWWTQQLDSGLSRSDMVASFVNAALTSDLTPENYPNLSAEQLAAGQLRQDLLTNKTEASLAFIDKLGPYTNIPDGAGEHPEEIDQYKASIAVLFGIGDNHATVDNVVAFLDSIKSSDNPIAEILKLRYNGSGSIQAHQDKIFMSGDIKLYATPDTILRDINLSIQETTLPTPLPTNMSVVGKVIDIQLNENSQEALNAPMKMIVRYDDSGLTDEHRLVVLHHNANTNQYEPVKIIAQDTTSNTITFESRTFSPFVIASIDDIPSSFDTGFTPSVNGWNISNFGSYFAPDGNAFGMAGYAIWYYLNKDGDLYSSYNDLVSKIIATRVQLSQSFTWGLWEWRRDQRLNQRYTGYLMKAYMSLLDQPLVMLAGVDGNAQKALVVYRYDNNYFYFYDLAHGNVEQKISFNGTSFGSYEEFNSFGFIALPSFGRYADFDQLASEASNGFTSSQDINLISPNEGDIISQHTTYLQGNLGDSLDDSSKMYATAKGFIREIPLDNKSFNQPIEISQGENTIVLIAGVDFSRQSNWAKDSAILIRNVMGDFTVSKLLVTLTWDQDDSDVDLYITDPAGDTMWYGNHQTPSGVTLDVDDVDGYGPEHGTLTLESASTSQILEGNYIVRVHYYDDHGAGIATGHINIVVNEGTDHQVEKTVPFTINIDDYNNDAPGSMGSDWVDIAVVDVANGVIH